MRIKELVLGDDLMKDLDNGLKEFESSRIPTTVALVGKNGSGKSRYLDTIEKRLQRVSVLDIVSNRFETLPKSIINSASTNKNLLDNPALRPEKHDVWKKVFENTDLMNTPQLRNHAKNHADIVGLSRDNLLDLFKMNSLVEREVAKRIKVVTREDLRALRKTIENTNSDGDKVQKRMTFQDVVDSTTQDIEINEFEMISESALTYLQRLPHQLALDDLETRGDAVKFKARVAYKRYQTLRNLVGEFLDKDLEWHAETTDYKSQDDGVIVKKSGYWTVKGRRFDFNDFSDGEKVLFSYALLLFLLSINPRVKFNESIIIIDEPELNLHPKAQIRLIESLQNLVKEKGQLIIATHSLSIVANLDYESIYLVRQNELLSPSSSVPFNSVDDLMGFDEHYHKIVEFLNSTPSWAMTHFMAQCFDDPDVIETASDNDPQVDVFKNLILQKDKLNILDYGSGKGRLLDKISESNSAWSRISNYDCFDIDDQHNEPVLKKGASNVYNDLKQIPNSKYDLIVLVNVLHEIRIDLWEDLLNTLSSSLQPGGFLAIVEDTELPIGELPNDHGFLILGEEEMTRLLGRNTKFITPTSERYKNRIICGFAKKTDLSLISKYTIRDTLDLLQMNALQSIQDLRAEKDQNNTKSGRLYGLHANHYVNVELAKQILDKS